MEVNASTRPTASLDETRVNNIGTLSMDAVQAANSGHPGTPMAPAAQLLRNEILRFDPEDPIRPSRDRFVLWQHYTKHNGQFIGMKTFGACAPFKGLTKKFDFTVENVVGAAKREIEKYKS